MTVMRAMEAAKRPVARTKIPGRDTPAKKITDATRARDLLFIRQLHGGDGALTGTAEELEFAAMAFDDAASESEAEAASGYVAGV